MSEHDCVRCKFRAKYDKQPQSLLGRIWRWHIRWCPGWKAFTKSLDESQFKQLAEQYNLPARK